jgi:hypothetical protein
MSDRHGEACGRRAVAPGGWPLAALAMLVLLAAPRPASARPRTAKAFQVAEARGQARGAARRSVLQAPAPAASPVAFRPVRARSRLKGAGSVAYVAAGRAYLDAGARDGLVAGQVLRLERRGRVAGTCTVEAVADTFASCLAEDVRAGDGFALEAAAEAPAAKTLARPLTPEETARRLAAVQALPLPRVDFTGTPAASWGGGSGRRIEVSLVQASWFASDSRSLHQEHLDVAVRGADLGGGLRLFLDLSAQYRSAASDTERFRPGQSAFLHLWEAQVAARGPSRSLTFAIGRVLPWHVPGSTPFDGAQVGWQGRGVEVGVFGGLVPLPATTDPDTQRATGGAYWTLELPAGDNLFRHEARVAVVRSPELGTRIEAEAVGQAWLWKRLDLSADARFGFAGLQTAPTSLDQARVQLGGRLGDRLGVSASYRYVGLLVPDAAAPALFAAPGHHGDASVSFDPTSALTVRALGGLSRDTASGLDRSWVGPEIAAPRLFGRRGGVSGGYLEEFGWLKGRSAYLQANAELGERLRLLGRVSWFSEARPPLSADNTVGALASLSYDLLSWLRFRISGLGRMGLDSGGASNPYGASILAGLDGQY